MLFGPNDYKDHGPAYIAELILERVVRFPDTPGAAVLGLEVCKAAVGITGDKDWGMRCATCSRTMGQRRGHMEYSRNARTARRRRDYRE